MSDKPKSKARSRIDAWGNAAAFIKQTIKATLQGVEKEVASRAYRASNELRNASLYILRGQRSGRRYRLAYTYSRTNKKTGEKRSRIGHRTYRASAPGEPPAVRTGLFRLSWGTHVRVERSGKTFRAVSAIESSARAGKYLLGELLEDGTPGGQMQPRPYKQAVKDRSMPTIQEIYKKPYKV